MYRLFCGILLLIRVLCIGNSFSWDAVEQELVPLCAASGVEIEVHNLYYGGCSLEQHARFLLMDTAVYSHRVCTNAAPRTVVDTISLRRALTTGRYDFVSFQQASHDSGLRSTYEPWLSMLVDTVKSYQPDARLCWMQTWAYSRDAKHPAYPLYQSDQHVMWDSIHSCTRYVLARHPLVLVPCGTAVQLARSTPLGDTLCRDGYHLNYTYGRYTAACVWYEKLTDKNVRRNRYKNPQMTAKEAKWARKSAHKAVKMTKNALF